MHAVGEYRLRKIELLIAVGARINALASRLELPLHCAEDYTRTLGHDIQASGASKPSADSSLRAELRGLLVLRYTNVGRCVEQMGDQIARDLLDCARVLLKCQGPAGREHGMNLRPLFDEF
jgi:hypothetical protein